MHWTKVGYYGNLKKGDFPEGHGIIIIAIMMRVDWGSGDI
jgi:hypothetical protein